MSAQPSSPNIHPSSNFAPKTLPNEQTVTLGSTNSKVILQVENPETVALLLADLARPDGNSSYKRLRKDL
jgi:hypothetical protein